MGWSKTAEDINEIYNDRLHQEAYERELASKTVNNYDVGDAKGGKKENTTIRLNVHTFKDKYIKCSCCENLFLFSKNQQAHFERKEWSEPKRCKECREIRKAWWQINSILGVRY